MQQLGFTFDLNKCVGCQACQIACSIENDLGYDLSWREINTFNPDQILTLSHYHLSLACNHCREPICLYQCPASAISKNPENGIVIIDEKKCIGCKFCSWVCPFDAPTYHSEKHLMTKCTLCFHRIEENLQPACVSICPTDALNTNKQTIFEQPQNLAGFPESEIRPCIQIEQLNPDQTLLQQYISPYSQDVIGFYTKSVEKIKNKISLSQDWTLILFTWFISILGAWLSIALFKNISIKPLHFLSAGLLTMGLSTLHLGKKFRAARAILNWKTSWLSREVIFFNIFLLGALLYLWDIASITIGFLALAAGYLTAISADHVYDVVARTEKRFFNSAQVWLSFIFLVCFFNQVWWGIYLFGFIKMFLYLKDKIRYKANYYLLFLRVTSFIIAILLLTQLWYLSSILFITFSELIDRIEFYVHLNITTPSSHMHKIFNNLISDGI